MQKETAEIIKKYLEWFPEDKNNLSLLREQIKENKNFFDRKNFTGHIVANTLIIKGDEILTIFHNKLKMFIQPGGHVDDTDASIVNAATREALEETGIIKMVLSDWHRKNGIPIFIESHLIPANLKKNEDEHYHHDFMYIFKTTVNNVNLQLEEVSDFRWIKIDEVLSKDPESFIGKSLKRMITLDILK